MKRLVALLLAVLLALGASAASETYRISVASSVSDEGMIKEVITQLTSEVAADNSSINVQSLEEFLYRLAADSSLTLVCQDTAVYAEIVLGGYAVLDMTLYLQEEQVLMTSTMMPGYAMVIPLTTEASDDPDGAALEAAFASIEGTWADWCGKLSVTEAQGSFTGDAYDGGKKCTTITLSDRDLAELLDNLLSDKVQAVLEPVLAGFDLSADDVFNAFAEKNAQVAANNAYSYIIRVVEDEEGQSIGASLTVLNGGLQVATVSLGCDESGARLVVGLGFEQQNYWLDMDAVSSTQEVLRCDTIRFREFVAPKNEGYAYAVSHAQPETSLTWAITSYQSGQQARIDCNVTDDITGDGFSIRSSCTEQPFAMDVSLYDQSASIDLSIVPAEDAILPMEDNLTTFTSSPSDAAVYDEALQVFSTRLAVRLLKVIPVDLLMLLQ